MHEVAEQLEHIHSQKLVDKLDEFLGYPQFDPHGDPIPNSNGEIPVSTALMLSEGAEGKKYKIVGVKDTSSAFLQQLERFGIKIGSRLSITEKLPYDNSLVVEIEKGKSLQLSEKIAFNLLVV